MCVGQQMGTLVCVGQSGDFTALQVALKQCTVSPALSASRKPPIAV